jgi:hypothetical protein
LGHTHIRLGVIRAVEYAYAHALTDESQQRSVDNPILEYRPKLCSVDTAKEGLDIGFQDPFHLAAVDRSVQGTQSVMGASPGSKAI